MQSNGGGNAPECVRADLHDKYSTMYDSANGKEEVKAEIEKLIGTGHSDGTREELIERIVTARYCMTHVRKESGVDDSDLDNDSDEESIQERFAEIGPEPHDFRQHQHNALRSLKRKVDSLTQDFQTAISRGTFKHDLKYICKENYCGVCKRVQGKDAEQAKTKLVCMTCGVYVCKSTVCLNAHLWQHKGKQFRDAEKFGTDDHPEFQISTNQGGHYSCPTRAPKKKGIDGGVLG